MGVNKETGLTDKQQAFINEYCANGYNGYQAAKAAGYKGSYNVVAHVAHENLQKLHIKAVIDAKIAERREKTEYDRDKAEQLLFQAHARAINKGDTAAEIAAIRELNTIYALRTENVINTTEQQRVLSAREAEECRRLAGIRLAEG